MDTLPKLSYNSDMFDTLEDTLVDDDVTEEKEMIFYMILGWFVYTNYMVNQQPK